jgi:hypothetical protein
VALLLLVCAVKAKENLPILMSVDCQDIAGKYSFFGVEKGSGRSKSFLHWHSRPALDGVEWIEIVNVHGKGKFEVSFMTLSGKSIGNVLELDVSCIDGQWERRRQYEGASDGTWVKGVDIWRYRRDESGALVVTSLVASTSQYFPWFSSRPRAFQGVASFPPYKGRRLGNFNAS